MKGKGFEIIVKDEGNNIVIDRSVNNIAEGDAWAKMYVDGSLITRGKEATLYVSGKPKVTHYNPE